MTPRPVDLLIVEHRSPADLKTMLESITGASEDVDPAVWIGLVDPDDSSIEITKDWLDRTPLRDGSVTQWATNVGYNRALNRLGTLGDADVIGCFNADVILVPGSLRALADAADQPDVGLVGPRQVWNGRIRNAGIFGEQTSPRFRGWNHLDRLGRYEECRDALYVQGSVVFLRRSVWDELTVCPDFRKVCDEPGPWLDVEHFYGDSYLSLHAAGHHYTNVYLGTTTVHHRCNARAMTDRDRPDRERFRAALDEHGIEHE